MVPAWLSTGMGVFALFAAILLLVQVTALKRVADGAAFTQHMAYVTGGILCLAAAVLLNWAAGVGQLGIDEAQGRFLSDALVGVSMVLLGVYFYRVRRAMARYLTGMGGEEALARAHETGEPEEFGA